MQNCEPKRVHNDRKVEHLDWPELPMDDPLKTSEREATVLSRAGFKNKADDQESKDDTNDRVAAKESCLRCRRKADNCRRPDRRREKEIDCEFFQIGSQSTRGKIGRQTQSGYKTRQ